MNIEELIRAARAGEDYAAPFLVSLFGERLLGYARAIASDISDTDRELVVAQAIEKAVRKIDHFDPTKGSFGGWLRGFVRFGLADWRRSVGSSVELTEDLQPTPMVSATVNEETSGRLSSALRELRATDALIIQLRITEQLSHSEIASRLGTSEEACRQRYRRALTRLRVVINSDPILKEMLKGVSE